MLDSPEVAPYGLGFNLPSLAGLDEAWRLRISSQSIKAVTSAGETPAIREAWPRFDGLIAASFSRASLERVAIAA